MSLDAAITIAGGGLNNIERQLAVVSQNIANAGTPSYATEVLNQTALSADGMAMGVRTGTTSLQLDAALQNQSLVQSATVSGLSTTSTALGSIDSALGQTGGASDLPSLLGNLQTAFSALQGNPGNQNQQDAVVAAAQNLTDGINTLADTYGQVRQTAQDNLVSNVSSLNTQLAAIGSLSHQIQQLNVAGVSTADLQNQLNAAQQSVSQLVGVRFLTQSNGSLLAITSTGVNLPLSGGTPLSIASATIGASSTYPGASPAILLDGTDVTKSMTGGAIGANLTLRDSTIPTYQGELDEFSANLANRFSTQGLTLFTDPTGNVPSLSSSAPVQSGYVGFANIIQVNSAVTANPSLVRDGTSDIAGSSTGASAFTTNPASGPAGFTTLITRVLNYSFGADVQDGVSQPAIATSGLGPTGALSAPFSSPATLADDAATLVASQAQDSATATGQLSTEKSVQTALNTQIGNVSGVSVDQEMSLLTQLQNAYAANAHVLSAAVQMWNDLVGANSTPIA